MNPWDLWQLFQQMQSPWMQMGTPWVNPLPVNTQLPQSPSGAGGAAPGTSSGSSPTAQAQGQGAAQPSFQDYLSMMYPGVNFSFGGAIPGSGSGTQGAGPPINPNVGYEWTGMFTPPAGQSRQPYPISVSGPASLTAPSPFLGAAQPPIATSDRER